MVIGSGGMSRARDSDVLESVANGCAELRNVIAEESAGQFSPLKLFGRYTTPFPSRQMLSCEGVLELGHSTYQTSNVGDLKPRP